MPNALQLIIGGESTSFQKELDKSVRQAQIAGQKIQLALRTKIAAQEKVISGLAPDSAEAIGRSKAISEMKLKLRLLESTQAAAIQRAEVAAAVKADAEKVAANKLAMELIVAEERKAGIAYQIEQEMEVAAATKASAEKLAIARATGNAIKLEAIGTGAVVNAAFVPKGNFFTKMFSGANWKSAMGELLVVMREIGRGNFARIPGSVSILIQRLGFLGAIISPVGLAVIALGAAAYFTGRHFKNLADGMENFQHFLRGNKSGLVETADELLKFQDAMRKTAEEAADFDSWLQKLGVSYKDLGDAADETLQSMRETFQLMKQLSGGKADKKTELSAEQDQRQKELDVVQKALAETRQRAAEAKTGAVQAEKDARTGSSAQMRSQEIADLTTKRDELKEAAKKSQELLNAIHDKGVVGENERVSVNVGGKKVVASVAETETFYNQQRAKEERANQQLEELIRTQRELDDALKTSKEKAEKLAESEKHLTTENDRLASEMSRHEVFDPFAAEQQKFDLSLEKMTPAQKKAALQSRLGELKGKLSEAEAKAVPSPAVSPEATKTYSELIVPALKSAVAGVEGELNSLDAAKQRSHGQMPGLNQIQRIGAYAAMPPDWSKLVHASIETAKNTAHLKPQRNSGHSTHTRYNAQPP